MIAKNYDPEKVKEEISEIEKKLSEELVDSIIGDFTDIFNGQLDGITEKINDLQENLNKSTDETANVLSESMKEFSYVLEQYKSRLEIFSNESQDILNETQDILKKDNQALNSELKQRNQLLDEYFQLLEEYFLDLEKNINKSLLKKIQKNIQESNSIISQMTQKTDELSNVFDDKVVAIRSDIGTKFSSVQQQLISITQTLNEYKRKNNVLSFLNAILVIVVIVLQIIL